MASSYTTSSSSPATSASSYTATAFVVHGGWSHETRKNAGFRYLEALAKDCIDARDLSKGLDFYTKDFTCTTPHADHHTSSDEQHALLPAVEKFYLEGLKHQKHVPYLMVAIKTKDGWDCHTQCHMYTNVHGDDSTHAKIKDEDGQEWDHIIPTFHYFQLVEDPSSKIEGLKCKHVNYMGNKDTVNETLAKRGVSKASKS